MILLRDIRDLVATLNIAEDDNVYCGKMDSKPDKAIGVYNLKSNRQAVIPIGGLDNKSYGTKAISILVHWNKYQSQTETAAINLYNALQQCKQVTINEHLVKYITMLQEEPICVDTDDSGIYEYVIECIIYYERE